MNQSRVTRYVAYPVTAILMVALATVVLFAACFVYETEKKVAFWAAAAIVAICVTPQFRRRLRERCSIFFLLVTAYILLAGASTFYAYAPKFALSEFSRLLAAYAVFLAVFSFAKRETLPNAAAVLCGATSLLSLLQLDAASGGLFAHKIMLKFQMWTGGGYTIDQYGQYTYGYNSAAGRLYGMFGNSNTMATMCAIGIFLALYLLLRAKGFHRLLPCAALVINAVTFIMCISFGATLSLGLTILLLLVCLPNAKERLSFLVITLETLAVAAVVAALSFPHMGMRATGGYLVLIYCVAGCALLFGVDYVLRRKVVDVLSEKIKVLCIVLTLLIILLVIGGIVAFTQASAVTLHDGTTLLKRFAPGGGTCEITVEMDGDAALWVASSSKVEILQEVTTVLYDAPYTGTVTLEIPEDSIELQLRLTPLGDKPVTVQNISYSDAQITKDIPAGYRWVPQEIATRLQSLSTNHSVMQRMAIMKDGLTMWLQAPVFGRGLGGFENGLASVQEFFYETKYAHNHYIQTLCDLGVVGLLGFVLLLVYAIKSLWPMRKGNEDAHLLFLSLTGVTLMYAIHGGLEISASVAEVSIFVFGAFGLIAQFAPVPASWTGRTKPIALICTIGIALLTLLYGFLLVQNARASSIVNQETVTTAQLKKCVEMDVFEGDDYRLTYVVAAMSIQDEEVYAMADSYADELQNGNSNAVGPYLTEYYIHRGNFEKAYAASEKFLTYTRSNSESWNTQFHIFEDASVTASAEEQEEILQIVKKTYQDMIDANNELLVDIVLDERSTQFLNSVMGAS